MHAEKVVPLVVLNLLLVFVLADSMARPMLVGVVPGLASWTGLGVLTLVVWMVVLVWALEGVVRR